MRSRSALAALGVLILLAFIGACVLGATGWDRADTAISRVGTLQGEQGTTVLESARTRVVTVRQRCELTALFLEEARRPLVISRLRASYAGCERQLVEVERINALAHGVHPRKAPHSSP